MTTALELWEQKQVHSDALPFFTDKTEKKTLWENMKDRTNTETYNVAQPFVKLVKDNYTALKNALKEPVKGSRYTVFLPADFTTYVAQDATINLDDTDEAKKFLQRHVVQQAVNLKTLPVEANDYSAFVMFEGGVYDTDKISQEKQTLKGFFLNRPVININREQFTVLRSIKASNGIIHVITGIIPDIEQTPVKDWTKGDQYDTLPLPPLDTTLPPPLETAIANAVFRQINL